MKKFLFLLGFAATILLTFPSFAQSNRVTLPMVPLNGAGTVKARDTSANTDTIYLMLGKGTADTTTTLMNTDGSTTQYCDAIYTWSTASLTGTTAYTGTVTFEGSMTGTFYPTGTTAANGSDWVTLTSSTAQYNGSSSIALAGGSNQKGYFVLPNNQFKYVRGVFKFSGTGTTAVTGSAGILPH